MARLVIVGAGGHGREVLDVVEACIAAGQDLQVLGFLDEGAPSQRLLDERGARLLGPAEVPADAALVLGIGDPRVRQSVAGRLDAPLAPPLVHPAASVGSRSTLGPGTVVAAGARLTTNVRIGRHGYVGPNATVGHDCVLEDFATLYPGAVVSGSVRIGVAATVGAGAAVRQGVTVGDGAVVALGAAVVRDVAPGETVAGVPARPLR